MLYGDGTLVASFTPLPHFGHNIYTLKVASPQCKAHTITYDIMHKWLGHPSKNVLKYVCNHMHNFPSSIKFLKEDTIYLGCMKGKMPACAWNNQPKCGTKSIRSWIKLLLRLVLQLSSRGIESILLGMGKTKRTWLSSLGGTFGLIYYSMCVYICIPDLPICII